MIYSGAHDTPSQVLGLGIRRRGSERRAAGAHRGAPRRALRRRGAARGGTAAHRRDRAAGAAHRAAAGPRRPVLDDALRSRRPHVRQVLPRCRARFPPRLRQSPRRRRLPAGRERGDGAPRVVRRCRGGGDSLRRGLERRGWRRGPGGRPLSRRGGDRSRAPRSGARDRSGIAGGTHPGGRARAGARGAASAARPHVASLSAVVRVQHARRLDRDPLRRTLRDPLHPHRRFRGIASRRHPDRRRRVAPSAGVGRRPEPGPSLHRLGGDARHHHRGVDALAGPTDDAGIRVGDVRRFRGGCDRGACARTERPLPFELPAARSGRGLRAPAPGRASRPCWCSASSRPIIRSTPGWRARSNAVAITAASCRMARGTRVATTPPVARVQPARGGRRSSGRRTCAMRSSVSG